MKDIREVVDVGSVWGFDINYEELIESCEVEIMESKYFGHYQGDIFMLLKDDDERYGFVSVGFGSCNMCDALLSCNTVDDLKDLRQSIYNNIKWKDSKKDLLDYLDKKEHENEYYYWVQDKNELEQFLNKVKEILK